MFVRSWNHIRQVYIRRNSRSIRATLPWQMIHCPTHTTLLITSHTTLHPCKALLTPCSTLIPVQAPAKTMEPVCGLIVHADGGHGVARGCDHDGVALFQFDAMTPVKRGLDERVAQYRVVRSITSPRQHTEHKVPPQSHTAPAYPCPVTRVNRHLNP